MCDAADTIEKSCVPSSTEQCAVPGSRGFMSGYEGSEFQTRLLPLAEFPLLPRARKKRSVQTSYQVFEQTLVWHTTTGVRNSQIPQVK